MASLVVVPVEAKTDTLTVNDFGENTNLEWKYYDAMRKGKISAVKQKGVWYYKFTGQNATVLVKASAFAGKVENDFTKVNDTLTEGIMNDGKPVGMKFTYKDQLSVKTQKVSGSAKSRNDKITTYTTYFAYLEVTGYRSDKHMELQCWKNGHIKFEYSDMVSGKAWFKNGYIKPSTAAQYVAALKRETAEKIPVSITPVFNLEVTVPGTNCVVLNSVEYKGRGSLGKNVNVLDLIEVATTTGKVTASMSTAAIPYDDLLSLASGMHKILMVEDNEDYTSDDKIYLSGKFNGKERKCLKVELVSPIALGQYDDYFRAEVWANKPFSTTKTKTQVKVTFSVE